MRSLQECQAEVFRRSRRKIRQRRKHTAGILLACIPLALCLMLLPKNSKEEKANDAVQQELSGSGYSVAQVHISNIKGSCSLTDSSEIRQLMGLMESYSVQHSLADGITGSIESEPEAAPETQPEIIDEDVNDKESAESLFEESLADRHTAQETGKGYTITLVMDDGSEIVYFLLENMMTDVKTGQVTVLSRQQAEELRAFLEGKVEDQ